MYPRPQAWLWRSILCCKCNTCRFLIGYCAAFFLIVKVVDTVVQVCIIVLLVLAVNFFAFGTKLDCASWYHHFLNHLFLIFVIEFAPRWVKWCENDRASRDIFQLTIVVGTKHLLSERVSRYNLVLPVCPNYVSFLLIVVLELSDDAVLLLLGKNIYWLLDIFAHIHPLMRHDLLGWEA